METDKVKEIIEQALADGMPSMQRDIFQKLPEKVWPAQVVRK